MGAFTYLNTEFACMFPQATFNTNIRCNPRHISATERETSRQHTGNDTYQPGYRDQPISQNGVTTFFGVDINDVGRIFLPQEMTLLGSQGQRYVYSECERLGLSRTRSQRGAICGRGSWGRLGGRGYYGRGCGDDCRAVGAVDSDSISALTYSTGPTPYYPTTAPPYHQTIVQPAHTTYHAQVSQTASTPGTNGTTPPPGLPPSIVPVPTPPAHLPPPPPPAPTRGTQNGSQFGAGSYS